MFINKISGIGTKLKPCNVSNKPANSQVNFSSQSKVIPSAKEFFGISSLETLVKKQKEWSLLRKIKQKDLKFELLGNQSVNALDSFVKSTPFSKFLHESKCGIITLRDPAFMFNDKPWKHTVALVTDNHKNLYVLDSLGDESDNLKAFHHRIKTVLKDDFADIIFNKKPQQTEKELSCLHWSINNIEQAQKQNLFSTKIEDVDRILNTPDKFDKIINDQMQLCVKA